VNGANYLPDALDLPEIQATMRRAVEEVIESAHVYIVRSVFMVYHRKSRFKANFLPFKCFHFQGHGIASHTWSHPNLSSLTTETIIYEMNTLSDKLEEVVGFRQVLMRPPNGDHNQTVVDIVNGELGYKIILWSIDSEDWKGDVEVSLNMYKSLLEGTNPAQTPGFIGLHHDPLPLTVDIVAQVIQYVQTTGYRFVGIYECLGISPPNVNDPPSHASIAYPHFNIFILLFCLICILKS